MKLFTIVYLFCGVFFFEKTDSLFYLLGLEVCAKLLSRLCFCYLSRLFLDIAISQPKDKNTLGGASPH